MSFGRHPAIRTRSVGAILGASLSLSACATHRATIDTFTDASMTSGQVECIAVFPIRNTRVAPSQSQTTNRKITQAVHSSNPDLAVVGPAEAVSRLNDAGMADEWADFLERYVLSGVPDAEALSRIGQALACDSVLQGEVVNVYQRDGEFGSHKGETRVTVRFTLLDARNGRLLWEASSDGVRKTAITTGDAPPLVEAVDLAVEKILQNLPPL